MLSKPIKLCSVHFRTEHAACMIGDVLIRHGIFCRILPWDSSQRFELSVLEEWIADAIEALAPEGFGRGLDYAAFLLSSLLTEYATPPARAALEAIWRLEGREGFARVWFDLGTAAAQGGRWPVGSSLAKVKW